MEPSAAFDPPWFFFSLFAISIFHLDFHCHCHCHCHLRLPLHVAALPVSLAISIIVAFILISVFIFSLSLRSCFSPSPSLFLSSLTLNRTPYLTSFLNHSSHLNLRRYGNVLYNPYERAKRHGDWNSSSNVHFAVTFAIRIHIRIRTATGLFGERMTNSEN